MIDVSCGHCGYSMVFKDENYGKRARCRSCKNVLKIMPAPMAPPPLPQAAAPVPAPAAVPVTNVHQNVRVSMPSLDTRKSRLVYFLWWFFLGGLGFHRFYGGTGGDVLMGIGIFLSAVFVGVSVGLWFLPHILLVVVVEGIYMLLRSDLK